MSFTHSHITINRPRGWAANHDLRPPVAPRGRTPLTASEWTALFERCRGLIARIARSYGLNAHEVEDVSQETWMRLLRSQGSIRDPNALAGWLATTARRESLRMLKRSRREPPTDDDLGADIGYAEDLDDIVISADRQAALASAMETLAPHQRRLIRLMLEEPQLTYAEVAERLGVPIGSVGPTRQRGVERLRRELMPHAGVLALEVAA